jgi:putative restriction endonuclease
VFVVDDSPKELFFSVAVDDVAHTGLVEGGADESEMVRDTSEELRRAYITSAVQVRLHQRAFRERVLDAYRRQCAFCRLRHEQLLDAAHIVPDAHPEGEPLVRNGLALCALHHTAFDRFFVGLRPDYVIEVRSDILHEDDGPTLVHAIQRLHGAAIVLPKIVEQRPDPVLVSMRYERFQQSDPERA